MKKTQIKKQMLIVTGSGNSGKSTAIKLAHHAILQRAIASQGITDARYLYLTQREVGVSIQVAVSIGIATRGDSASHVLHGLNYFLAQKCAVIVCATRSRGASLLAAENFANANGFAITYMQKAKHPVVSQQSPSNVQFSRKVSAWACHLLGI